MTYHNTSDGSYKYQWNRKFPLANIDETKEMFHWSIVSFFVSFILFTRAEYFPADEIPLAIVPFDQRNVTIYTSARNPSRDPKTWRFWYDPMFNVDSLKDIHQFNEVIRFRFTLASNDFDQIARTTIISKMHPDAAQFSLSWTIEPLPIDTLHIYVINQKNHPAPAIYPCTKYQLSGPITHECHFQASSMFMANWINQNIRCGKLKLQLTFYVQSKTRPIHISPSLVTKLNLNTLRSSFDLSQYIHPRREKSFVEQYFLQLQSIDDAIKEIRVQKLFRSAMNLIPRVEIRHWKDLWPQEDLETILNQDLFYVTTGTRNQLLFRLKATDSPWALISAKKQSFDLAEMQQLISDQLKIQAEWSFQLKRWLIKSIFVHFLTDVFDHVQLALINQQYLIDKTNATFRRNIDCSEWSSNCVCQTSKSALVFISDMQLIRIPNLYSNFSQTGLTFEIRIRPDALPLEGKSVRILNIQGEYYVTYQAKGEITFSIIDQNDRHLYTTTLQSIPLNQWTHLAGVYSVRENQLQLFLNGEFVSSIVHTKRSQPINNDIIIGQQFVGAVRDLRIWGCPLTSDEIQLSMQVEDLNGNETCLAGYWPMADGSGQIVSDLVVNSPAHPGTLGFDGDPNFVTDPIWTYVLPTPPPPPPPPEISYRIFRENITSPFMAVWGSIWDLAVPADYDGDGFADFAVYRPIALTWMVASSHDPNVMYTKFWGLPGDIPVQCNLDGDKFFDYTIFRPSTAEWIGHITSNPNFVYTHRWGKPNDRPAPGDFDGDGKTDFTVFRQGAYYINPSSDPSIQWTKQWGQPGELPVSQCDFDGDGRTDFTVASSKTGIWSWIPSSSPWLIYQKQWGSLIDAPLCGDFDGDKHRDFVAYRNFTGEWFILPYRLATFLITFQWGFPTDFPVAGDYDGDGRAEFGLWRPRTNRSYVWEIIPSLMPSALLRKGWGIKGDVPLVADFDKDRKDEFTVWRPSTGFWYNLLIGSPGIQQIKHWGFSINDTAVAGDWDGDGYTDYTIYRPSTGYWYIMLSRNPILQIFMQWGAPQFGDIPVPGDFDGDGKSDFAVWRPSTGVWFILPSTNPATIVMSQWGINGDIPVTGADFDGDGKTDVAVWRPSTGSWYILPSSNPVYPFFGPLLIKQPLVTLPPPPGAAESPAAAPADAEPTSEPTEGPGFE